MGMSIEEENRYTNACIKYLQKNMECVNFRDYIIERLNKYQKIQELLDDGWNRTNAVEVLLSIEEVLDGNDDCN